MKGKISCFLVLILLIPSLVCVSSRPFAPNDGHAVNSQGTNQNPKSLKREMGEKAEKYKEISSSKIGSIPPRCEHKCFGCSPCEPIQVPTKSSRLGVQYTNYEPEGWKCKCGPTFYTP